MIGKNKNSKYIFWGKMEHETLPRLYRKRSLKPSVVHLDKGL